MVERPQASSPAESQGALFAMVWAVGLLFDRSTRGMTSDVPSTCIVALAMFVLFRPTSPLRLVALAISHLCFLLWIVPRQMQVHFYLDGVVNLTIVAAAVHAAWRARSHRIPMSAFVASFGGAGRLLLLVAMFSVGFSKLNRSFVDASTSCASALYDCQRLTFPFSLLPQALWAKWIAVALTIVTEVGVPLLLPWKRLRPLAFPLAFGFFFLIGTNPINQLYEFSTPFVALLTLFFPPRLAFDVWARFVALRWVTKVGAVLAERWVRVGLLVLVALFAFYFFYVGDRDPITREERFVVARSVYVVGLLALGLGWAFGRIRMRLPEGEGLFAASGSWLYVIPLLFALHESTTYLGLRHAPALTMASNLQIDASGSNHLLVTQVPDLGFNRVVTLLDSSDPALRGRGRKGMVWLAFRDYLSRHPDVSVRFELDGRTEDLERAGEDPRFRDPSLLALLLTRPGPGGNAPLGEAAVLVIGAANRSQQCHHTVGQLRRHRAERAERLERARAHRFERLWR